MCSVLVVDDNPLIAAVVGEAISDKGHEVVTAHCASEAYSALRAEPRSFAVIVTDIDLGAGDNGVDVARQARVLNPAIGVAYMSGNPSSLQMANAPGSMTFSKPFSPELLADRIEALIA
jgi:two-component system nitrogen regulation response regulator GlnG